MKRVEFKRTTPEAEGISSKDVYDFLQSMNDGHTELHSLMIMRHDSIIMEAWASPYAQGMRHTMMSTSKTFTATAIALAVQEGILSLEDKIVDIFAENVPEDASEYLKEINIYHLLTMSSGMDSACVVDENYISNFMRTPVNHKPGTDFFYNDSAVTLLPLILYKKTGLSILEFLKPRLFDKIGIDTENLTWFNVATGTAFGAGGLFCTTEDALRLMKLYANGGKWNGEQILSKEYVSQATKPHIPTNTNTIHTSFLPKDNQYGYGYLMWMGSKEGTYRSEGAYGQITLVDPATDIIISFTEANHSFDPASQESMNRCWEFLEKINPNIKTLQEDAVAYQQLQNACQTLALEKAPYAPFGNLPTTTYTINSGAHPENLFYVQVKAHPIAKAYTGITSFSFQQEDARLYTMNAIIHNQPYTIQIPTDGSMSLNHLPSYYTDKVLTSGYFKDKHTFIVRFRWIETVFVKELAFYFNNDKCYIKEYLLSNDSEEKSYTYHICK